MLGFAAFVGFYLSDGEPNRPESDDRSIDQVELFAEVLWRIRDEYVDSVDEADLVENAIRSILADLDEHSRFLDEEAYEDTLISFQPLALPAVTPGWVWT